MRELPHRALLLLVLASALILGGCDPNITLQPQIETNDPTLAKRVGELEGEVAKHKGRADRLQAEVERLEGESVVMRGEDRVTVRLNTPAAVVLVFAILALTLFFVAKMHYAREARRTSAGDSSVAAEDLT